jgi:hypothetical protein
MCLYQGSFCKNHLRYHISVFQRFVGQAVCLLLPFYVGQNEKKRVGDSSYLIKGGFEMRMLVSASSETLELKGF